MSNIGTIPSAPTTLAGYRLKPEAVVRVGKLNMFGSLDSHSYAYTTWGIPVGMDSVAGQYIELGGLVSVGANLALTWEPVETANLPQGTIYDLTSEELTITVEVQEFRPELFELMMHTTALTEETGKQKLYATGGGCSMVSRPITIEFTNVACDKPSSPDLASGVSGGILTVYDAIISNGMNFENINRNNLNTISLEFRAKPVPYFPQGRRLCSLWLY